MGIASVLIFQSRHARRRGQIQAGEVSYNPSRLIRLTGLAALAAFSPPGFAQSASDDLPPPRDATVAPRLTLAELIDKDYPVAKTTDAFAAPVITAASLAKIDEGMTVRVVGLIEGNRWYQIELPDKRLAYVEVAAIPAVTTESIAAQIAAQATAPPTEPAAAPEPASTQAAAPGLDLPPILDFRDKSEQLKVVNPTAAYLAPDKRAPQAYPLTVGTRLEVVAKSRDGAWDWVMAADGTPLFVPSADAARPAKPEQAAGPDQRPQPGQ